MSDTDSWVADGGMDAEPVTVETPAAPTVESWAEAPVESAPVEVVEAVVEAAEAAPTEEAAAEIVQNFIDAQHGDETFQIPEGLLVPQKRNGQTEMVSIEDVLKRGMMGNDYNQKTTEHAQAVRDHQRAIERTAAQEARLQARSAHIDKEEARIKAALSDPASAAAYEEHLVQYANNPMYRQNVDASLAQEENQAELNILREREDQRVVNEAGQMAQGWLAQYATEFPNVDADRVRVEYGRSLSNGTASLNASEVRRLFEAEAQHVNATLSPLQDQLAEMRATIEAMNASTAADTHNEATQHAVTRSKAPKVVTGRGAPAKVASKQTKFGVHELQDRKDAWSAVR
tara:strand:- start:3810 stop:4844 length:1035 start_codon:yes stop_codon:yes gene_type:complete